MADRSARAIPHAVRIEDALAAHREGRLADAAGAYRAILTATPRHFDALHLLGVVCTQQGRFEEAATLIGKALKLNPKSFDAHYNLGIALGALGRHRDATSAYRRALAINPKHALALNNLGVSLHAAGKVNDAVDAFRRALAAAPDYAEAHYNLARALAELGQHEDAIAGYSRAAAIKPDYTAAYINRGAALEALNRYQEAEESLQQALVIEPKSIEAHNNLGVVLRALKRYDDAIACLQQAVTIDPTFAEAWNNLGNALKDAHRHAEAVDHYRQAIAIKPDYAVAWSNLGNALGLLNRHDEAIVCYRKALEINPDFPEAHSFLIFTLDFLSGSGFEEQQRERALWYRRHGLRFAAAVKPHENDRDPDRRLRIGYVSADFRRHSAALAFGPVVRGHDPSGFDVVLYSNVKVDDELTQTFKEAASLWRPVATLSDDALAAQIHSDRIDILVDLSGHTEGNRLLAFARKPAPVQMTAWGHALGTGIPGIDYFLADPVSVPADVRSLFAETVIDLPSIITYEAPAYAPAVRPSPVTLGRPLTFGCFNRLSKITPQTAFLWARLLGDVTGARLVLKDSQLSNATERQRMADAFSALGIDPARLVLLPGTPHADHLAAYGEMDIALDPFPTNGGVTTTEALWMGVPVVALLGRSVSSRVSAGILAALGLDDWIARSEDEYLAIAARYAADPVALAALRQHLRPKMQASPVGNAQAYCRAVEGVYRSAWTKYCRA
jgi:predicted O-linked N-acetylglucosamine transferase (SPINDLY family)